MSRTIFFTCNKGGVCKSTLAMETVSILANAPYNKKCLLISTDMQCDVDNYVGFTNKIKTELDLSTIYDVFTGKCSVQDAIVETKYGFDILLADKRLSGADKTFVEADDYYIMQDIISYLPEYDYIIIDSGRAKGFLFTSCLYVVDDVIIPVSNDSGSTESIYEIRNDIKTLKRRGLSHANIRGLIMGKYENANIFKETNNLLGTIATKLSNDKDYPNDCVRFTPVRKSVIVDTAKKNHMPTTRFKPWSDISIDYRRFVKELITSIEGEYSYE